MSFKFLSRLRDKDKLSGKVKQKHAGSSCCNRPIVTHPSLDTLEVQIISWNADPCRPAEVTSRGSSSNKVSSASPRTPVYEGFSKFKTNYAPPLPSKANLTPQPSAASVLNRSRTPTDQTPEIVSCSLRAPLGITTPQHESDVTSESSKAYSHHAGRKNPDFGSSSTSQTLPSRGTSITIHPSDSALSIASTSAAGDDSGHAPVSTKAKSVFSLGKKASLSFLRGHKNLSSSTDNPSSPYRISGRNRSSSMTSLSSTVAALRFREKVPSMPTPSKRTAALSTSVSPNRAPSSWRVAVSPESTPYMGAAPTAETDLASSTGEGVSNLTKAKNAIMRARNIKKQSVYRGGGSSSGNGSDEAHAPITPGVAETRTSFGPVGKESNATAEAGIETNPSTSPVAVKVSSPGLPSIPLPLHSSPTKNAASLGDLMASQLFKQMGPPPIGLHPAATEDRVVLVVEYVESQSQTTACPTTSIRFRSSLPPPCRLATRTARRGLPAASVSDEFDKLECQIEREMLKLLARGVCDRSAIEELRLDSVFLEARRRCEIDSSRTHFQLFENHGDSPNLGTSLASVISDSLAQMPTDTLAGLAIPMRPAPRRRKRPTTAPETGPKLGNLPSSPLPSNEIGHGCEMGLLTKPPSAYPQYGSPSANPLALRRGSDDRESSIESHTTRSVRSPGLMSRDGNLRIYRRGWSSPGEQKVLIPPPLYFR